MGNLTNHLSGVANAIRAKKGTSATIPASNFASEIQSIQTNASTNDATATAATIRSGYTAYAGGSKITGTLPTYTGSTTVTPSSTAQTLATSGQYLSGNITVNAQTAGTNTDDATATAASIRSGLTAYAKGAKLTGTLPTYSGATTVTPSASAQTLSTNGNYMGSNITVNAASPGTNTGDATATAATLRSGYTAYAGGSKITGTLPTYSGATTVTPVSYAQTLSTAGTYMGSNITVNAGTNTSDATATAATIRSGYTAYVNGSKLSGTLPTYSGATAVTPGTSTQTLSTAGTYMGSNITVYAQSGSFKSTSGSRSYTGHIDVVVNFYPRVMCMYTKWGSTYRHGWYFNGTNYSQGASDGQVSRTYTITSLGGGSYQFGFTPNGTNGTVSYWIAGD